MLSEDVGVGGADLFSRIVMFPTWKFHYATAYI